MTDDQITLRNWALNLRFIDGPEITDPQCRAILREALKKLSALAQDAACEMVGTPLKILAIDHDPPHSRGP